MRESHYEFVANSFIRNVKASFGLIAYLTATIYDILQYVFAELVSLLITPLDLILLMLMALAMDMLTGLLNVRRQKKRTVLYSHIIERTGWRLLMYLSTVILAMAIANASEGRFAEPVLQHLGVAMIFFWTLVELESIRENWQAVNFFKGIKRLIKKGEFIAPKDNVMEQEAYDPTECEDQHAA